MRLAWDRIAVVLVSAGAWAMVLLAGPHLMHGLRTAPRLLAHAGAGRRLQG
ncbi:hypothetical protein V7S57_24900 [Caulobacter sp. CCNWLY153]|jgi:hypothetical protein|uniref:hypothetical protein n=1 Tax=Caulobacter TaxID=75 RepID=UPI001403DE0F|nr:hypothetical protein [Caulobacter radicis]HVK42287.1 hypothetical protein [Phenylobacterium sp.]